MPFISEFNQQDKIKLFFPKFLKFQTLYVDYAFVKLPCQFKFLSNIEMENKYFGKPSIIILI